MIEDFERTSAWPCPEFTNIKAIHKLALMSKVALVHVYWCK